MSLNNYNLTPRAKKAFKDGQAFAAARKEQTVNNFHILYGCLANSTGETAEFLSDCGVQLSHNDLNQILDIAAEKHPEFFKLTASSDPWHSEILETLKEANEISNELDQCYIGIEHLLLGILSVSGHILGYLETYNIDTQSLVQDLRGLVSGDSEKQEERVPRGYGQNVPNMNDVFVDIERSMDALSKFGTNLNILALSDKLPQVHGRDKEISVLIEVLSKKNKSNAILIGETGVGKTAVVEGLASKIAFGDVPASMMTYEIISIDLARMVAGTRYRGDFEEKFQTLMQIAKANPNIVLFFDEIHNIFSAGNSEGSMDASNMLKPYLTRGDIKCIGATTTEEYQKIFEKDSAMKRRFEPIEIKEPSKGQTYDILINSIDAYENFHAVKFRAPIIEYIINCCEKFIPHRRFPDKAFDVIDQIGAKVKIANMLPVDDILEKEDELYGLMLQGKADSEEAEEKIGEYFETMKKHIGAAKEIINVKKSDVDKVIAEISKVSISEIKDSGNSFDKFYKNITQEVFGQNQNLQKINDILSCSKIGLNEDNKPLASFFFVGPTSVGKTYTAKKIAKYFYGNEKAFVQVNMSELQDETGVSKLIGANAGYVGFDQGGFLTNFVRNNPNCVVLFDEVEKSHPKILNLLLHLLDEGYMTDNLNRKVDFSKTIVVLTSNIGHKESSKASMGFVPDATPRVQSYKESVKKELKPELLARINEVIVFDDLTDDGLLLIIKSEIKTFAERLLKQNIKLKIPNDIYSDLLAQVKKEKLHARQLKEFVRQKIVIPTARFVVANPKKSEISIKILDTCLNIR